MSRVLISTTPKRAITPAVWTANKVTQLITSLTLQELKFLQELQLHYETTEIQLLVALGSAATTIWDGLAQKCRAVVTEEWQVLGVRDDGLRYQFRLYGSFRDAWQYGVFD